MSIFYLIILVVIVERLAELMLANRNARKLKAEGGIEYGARHYPLFILLHAGWLLSLILTTPANIEPNRWLLVIFLLLQLGRVWVIATLGRFWTTRIISLPDAPLVKRGPYRFFAHPNYMIVTVEIVLLPLVFDNWLVAIIWSLLNAVLLAWRIHVEEIALSKRRLTFIDVPRKESASISQP